MGVANLFIPINHLHKYVEGWLGSLICNMPIPGLEFVKSFSPLFFLLSGMGEVL